MKSQDKNKIMDDNLLRELMGHTQIKANENMKFRIMKQIHTEAALARKTNQESTSSLYSIIALISIVSLIIITYMCFVYFGRNQNDATSINLLFTYIIPICSVLSFLTFIFAIDSRIRDKKSKKYTV